MKTSVICPACQASISVLRIMAAPTPFHVKCPTCRVRVVAKAVELDGTTLVCALEAYHVRPGGERIIGRGRQVQRIMPRNVLDSLIARAAS